MKLFHIPITLSYIYKKGIKVYIEKTQIILRKSFKTFFISIKLDKRWRKVLTKNKIEIHLRNAIIKMKYSYKTCIRTRKVTHSRIQYIHSFMY
jgi:hypothetical protein